MQSLSLTSSIEHTHFLSQVKTFAEVQLYVSEANTWKFLATGYGVVVVEEYRPMFILVDSNVSSFCL